MSRISIRETNRTIHWMEIYPVDSAFQRLNNRDQVIITHATYVCSQHLFELPLRMNGMDKTQFDHARFDLLPFVPYLFD